MDLGNFHKIREFGIPEDRRRMDEELINVMSFGVYYEYSARQDCKLWLDDILISGAFIRDTIQPF